MCNSKIQSGHAMASAAVAEIDGRPVLQPASNTSNRIATPEAGRPLKKTFHKSISLPTSFTKHAARSDVVDPGAATLPKLSPPVSPKLKPAAKAAPKRSNDPNGLNTSTDKPSAKSRPAMMTRSKSSVGASQVVPSLDSSLLSCDRAPGSIAAAQREHAVLMQAQRKMRIAHYGRTPAKLEGKVVPVDSSVLSDASGLEEKRCSFITPNSDPVNIAYHDQEWGVPVHDDKMLFELLVLAGAQVGLDWTTILKKRGEFRAAFAEFDAELVSKYTEKQMASISAAYGLDLGRVRGVVDNAKRILEVSRELGSLDKYLWGFVNRKPLSTNYTSCRKIPVKTSKSESISKDMVRRGFRFVGPTVVHSFMQAAGLTNDHLLSCPRHLHCRSLSATN
ncbi:Methyladenine glycosylase [Musa troglodytarum]|uniref:Methyladenine glycosylase n=1 Tax=Musa troglodytarum TaxID=320322 RepID=A0A9E7FNM4_9LILI|nr:Methyladenine glycosylase [Musa troglodytarum]